MATSPSVAEPKATGENFVPFGLGEDGLSGYMTRDGNVIIEPRFDFCTTFEDGIALVVVDGKYGYLLPDGEYLIEPRFERAYGFSEGLAAVQDPSTNQWGFIDRTGSFVIKPTVVVSESDDPVGGIFFAEGLCRVPVNYGGDTVYGFINKEGKVVVEPVYIWAGDFHEGRALICVDDKYGYIDSTGAVKIEPTFAGARDYSEGLAAVQLAGVWGFVDRDGRQVIKPRFTGAGDFSEGLAAVGVSHGTDALWGYIDNTGKTVIDPKFEFAWSFGDGLAAYYERDKCGFIDKRGQVVIKPMFVTETHEEYIPVFNQGITFARRSYDESEVAIDTSGRVLEPKPSVEIHALAASLVNDYTKGTKRIRTQVGIAMPDLYKLDVAYSIANSAFKNLGEGSPSNSTLGNPILSSYHFVPGGFDLSRIDTLRVRILRDGKPIAFLMPDGTRKTEWLFKFDKVQDDGSASVRYSTAATTIGK